MTQINKLMNNFSSVDLFSLLIIKIINFGLLKKYQIILIFNIRDSKQNYGEKNNNVITLLFFNIIIIKLILFVPIQTVYKS